MSGPSNNNNAALEEVLIASAYQEGETVTFSRGSDRGGYGDAHHDVEGAPLPDN